MACPYFYPVARLEEDLWAVPPRLPLVDAYRGECRTGLAAHQPDDQVMRSVCNCGYARGRCDRFPADARGDAVRFSVASEEDGRIRIQYILEKSCWPLVHDEMEFSIAERSFRSTPADPIVARQAEAFVESYLRRAR